MKIIFVTILSFISLISEINIEHNYTFFETNSMNNIFLITDHSIYQYNYSGKEIQSYSNSEYGNLHSIDVNNPFKILLFYKDFNTIVFLDNKLAEISTHISLDKLNIYETNAVCISSTGGFWLFNTNTFQLEKYNKKQNLLQYGTKMESIIDRSLLPNYLSEIGNKIYLGFKNKGVYLFDIYGTFIKFIPIPYKSKPKIINNYIFYDTDTTINRYNTRNFESKNIHNKYNNNEMFSIEKNKIFIGSKNNITIHSK